MDKLKDSRLWWFFFCYTFVVSVFMQIVLLPYILSMWHAGHGLLNSSFDSICFHKLAVDLVNKIRIHGWSAWQLRPDGHAPAGIAAIFYFFLLPEPWTLIPLIAILHASAALILVKLVNLFLKDQTKAIICVLPFLTFPSNSQWIAQLHKDGFSILGLVLIVYSLVSFVNLENLRSKNWLLIISRSIIFYILGIFLIWVVRPFMTTMLLFISAPLFFSIIVTLLVRAYKGMLSWRKASVVWLLLLLIFGIMLHISVKNKKVYFRENVVGLSDSQGQVERVSPQDGTQPSGYNVANNWIKSTWLPSFIESKFYYLAQARNGFRVAAPTAQSNIDLDVGFNSVKSTLMYLPRAAQISLFAPFPSQWFSVGSYAANTLMRRIIIFEMVITYFALFFLPYAIWYWRKRIEIWIIVIYCNFMMLVYGLVVCNVGTLYRMKYMYITTLIAFGIAGFIVFLEKLKIKKE